MIVNIIEKSYEDCRFKDVWSGLISDYAVNRLLEYLNLSELKGQLRMIEKINIHGLGYTYAKYILKGNKDKVLVIKNDFTFSPLLKLKNIHSKSMEDIRLDSPFKDLIKVEKIYPKLILII
ncbi:hypothetical protein [Sporohalobacter salinus]|uniref:hypothetical protein n=1 Tax=Sporohalobacter salinus TaxID=1494606 RepID=UPI00196059BC|nr:hypothetical protein [Sporohalobacter salinus]MBM7624864.1 hypothetical protein [Sporohalobacter salinus]